MRETIIQRPGEKPNDFRKRKAGDAAFAESYRAAENSSEERYPYSAVIGASQKPQRGSSFGWFNGMSGHPICTGASRDLLTHKMRESGRQRKLLWPSTRLGPHSVIGRARA